MTSSIPPLQQPERPVDLHSHSDASDGSFTPEQLVRLAVERGLVALAITDHDTVSGVPKFLEAATRQNSLQAVPGVELSVSLNSRELHLLGLFIDTSSETLNTLLKKIRTDRDARNAMLLAKLNASGYEITMEEVLKIALGESIGRPHIARVLVEKGYFKTPQEVFIKCLRRGCQSYCPRILPQPKEAIDAIHAAGGLAVWAHPIYGHPSQRSYVRRNLKILVPLGLDGIEAYYSLFSKYQTSMLLELATEFKLLVSGGSDFHGLNQPGIELGTGGGDLHVPESAFLALRDAWTKRQNVR